MLITNIKSILVYNTTIKVATYSYNLYCYNLNHWIFLNFKIHIYNHSVKLKVVNKPGGIQ